MPQIWLRRVITGCFARCRRDAERVMSLALRGLETNEIEGMEMSQLDVLALQKVTAQTGGEYQTITSSISWSRCGGVSALSHNKCGWD